MPTQALRGVIAPNLTPFNADLTIAEDIYLDHAAWLIEQGCAGLAPFGTTCEALSIGMEERLYLGNLDALRDWGDARDYVDAQWRILQHDVPDDYVIAIGEQHSVREFVSKTFERLNVDIEWSGSGLEEQGRDKATGKLLVEVDARYFRPTEVETLLGDASKARQVLGWRPQRSFDDLVEDMVRSDLKLARFELEHGAVPMEAVV